MVLISYGAIKQKSIKGLVGSTHCQGQVQCGNHPSIHTHATDMGPLDNLRFWAVMGRPFAQARHDCFFKSESSCHHAAANSAMGAMSNLIAGSDFANANNFETERPLARPGQVSKTTHLMYCLRFAEKRVTLAPYNAMGIKPARATYHAAFL